MCHLIHSMVNRELRETITSDTSTVAGLTAFDQAEVTLKPSGFIDVSSQSTF